MMKTIDIKPQPRPIIVINEKIYTTGRTTEIVQCNHVFAANQDVIDIARRPITM